MTREEAYNRIDAIIAKHEIDDEYVTIISLLDYDALRMARKALEQEPCEDAISRQAVEKITWEEPSYTDALNVLTEVREKIRQLPSVKSNVNVDALINKIETEFSWSMYDDWGNSTDLHDGLVDIIREWAESEEINV